MHWNCGGWTFELVSYFWDTSLTCWWYAPGHSTLPSLCALDTFFAQKKCLKRQWCQVSQYHSLEMLTALGRGREKRQRSCKLNVFIRQKSCHVFSRGRSGRGLDLFLSLQTLSGLMCFFVTEDTANTRLTEFYVQYTVRLKKMDSI